MEFFTLKYLIQRDCTNHIKTILLASITDCFLWPATPYGAGKAAVDEDILETEHHHTAQVVAHLVSMTNQ